MESAGGYNPIRWDCAKRGCWNTACRPNIEFFAHCFPRKIGLTDIDGFVELNGHFLVLEWKSHQGEIPTGQRKAFERLTHTSKRIKVIGISHDPGYPMAINSICQIRNGAVGRWEPCDLDGLYQRIENWAGRTSPNGHPHSPAPLQEGAPS